MTIRLPRYRFVSVTQLGIRPFYIWPCPEVWGLVCLKIHDTCSTSGSRSFNADSRLSIDWKRYEHFNHSHLSSRMQSNIQPRSPHLYRRRNYCLRNNDSVLDRLRRILRPRQPYLAFPHRLPNRVRHNSHRRDLVSPGITPMASQQRTLRGRPGRRGSISRSGRHRSRSHAPEIHHPRQHRSKQPNSRGVRCAFHWWQDSAFP